MSMDPDLKKPKLEKQRRVPMTYGKRVMIKPTGLAPIKEEELSQLEQDLNDAIYRELGTYGDIVEASRKQILEGYVRPKGKYRAPKKAEVLPVAPLPDLMEDFAETFEERSRSRWSLAQKKEEDMQPPSKIVKAASDAKEVTSRLGMLALKATSKASKYFQETKFFGDSSDEERDRPEVRARDVEEFKKKVKRIKLDAAEKKPSKRRREPRESRPGTVGFGQSQASNSSRAST
jgi:hypothetical protein